MSELVGKVLGSYQVLLKIRSTPTNTIYKAYDVQRGRNVTLQVVLPSQNTPETLLPRLKEHAQILSKLAHPNIGVLLDCEQYENEICLVYDFVPRGVLRRRFNQKLSWVQASRLLIPAAQALTFVHHQGVIHGHLCPSSILMDENGAPVLFDFGVETIIQQALIAQAPGKWAGSDLSSYLAPEQVQGKPYDLRADIYAFGMIFFELVAGKRPFRGETPVDELLQQYLHPNITPGKTVKDLPNVADKILTRSLAANPAERFQEMQHLTLLLGRTALNQPVTQELVKNPNWQPRKPLPPVAWVGILAVLILALGLAGYFAISRNPNAMPLVARFITTPTAPPTVIAAVTNPTATPTPQPTATLQPYPTKPATLLPAATETPLPSPTVKPAVFNDLPVLFNTPVPATSGIISTKNVARLVTLSRLGIGKLNDITWSKDGKLLALATSTGVYVLDSQTHQMQYYLNAGGPVFSVAFSPTDPLMAMGDQNGLVQLWDTQTGKNIFQFSGHLRVVRRVTFSPDGKFIASASEDKTARLWDVQARKELALQTGGKAMSVLAVTGVAFSPDSRTLATVSMDAALKLWSTTDGAFIRTLQHNAAINDVAFTPDGKQILTGGSESGIAIWNLETGERGDPLPPFGTAITELDISQDGRFVAAGDQWGQVKVYDRKGKVLWTSRNERLPRLQDANFESTHRTAFSPDSALLASGIWDDTIRIWKAGSGEDAGTISEFSDYVTALQVSPESRYLAAQTTGGEVKVWELRQGKLLYTFPGTLTGGHIFSYDSKYLAIKVDPSRLRIYDLGTGKEVYTFGNHSDLRSISFSKDGVFLASGEPNKLNVWSLYSGQEIVITTNFGYNGCTVAYDNKENKLAYVTRFNYIDFTSVQNTKLCEFSVVGWMTSTTFLNDGNMMAAGGASKLAVWDYKAGDQTQVDMQGLFNKRVNQIALSPDGQVVAAVVDDLTIYVWDVKTGVSLIPTGLVGHDLAIKTLTFSQDGAYLISAANDGTIRIWGVQ